MKTLLSPAPAWMGACLLGLVAGFARGASLRADSKITTVTVYADRAVVTRAATVALGSPGGASLTFDRLPATLVDASVQVAGHGTADATILDATTRPVYVDYTPNPRLKPLEDEQRDLRQQQRALDDRAAVLKSQQATLDRIEAAATATPTRDGAPRLTIDESAKLLTFLAEQRTKFAEQAQSLDQDRAALAGKLAALERQIAELHPTGGRGFKTVTVRLDAKSAGDLELALTYAVPGASWTPAYDVRVDADRRSVALGYFGLVRQNTGEDWRNVTLTLSTARPSLGGQPPPLLPWTLDVPHPQVSDWKDGKLEEERKRGLAFAARAPKGWGNFVTSSGGLALVAQTDQPLAVAVARLESQATSASFRVPTAATVASDNAPEKIPITSVGLDAAPEYLAVPKQLAAAFLTAKVTNPSDFPLLAGAMNVFLDGTFLSAGSLPTVMPGEKFDLALGVDDGIAVARKLNRRFTEETGIMTKGQRITYDAVITVQNHKRTAEKVVILDQVPVSRDEKIRVKVLAPDAGVLKPEVDGTLRWTVALQPGEKRELPVRFSIEHDNDVAVTGLD
ncbi:MAG TPA: mucoidy inhibitor MuiA family protein [Opitutaceae bacterium]|nr:mucoidy inhibitor MuiA family protein [Opitutaceae bacterium]